MLIEGPRRHLRIAVMFAVFGGIAVFAALRMNLLCDDAYIAFRYVSNARDGRGLCWNPPPFQPVEGYTSWLWVMLLWATWSVLGIEPPAAAPFWSILCGLGQLVVITLGAAAVRDRKGNTLPVVVIAAMLAVVVGNRTFVRWMTSGLETALFNLTLVAWVVLAFRRPERRSTGWLVGWSTVAALSALTRPDGLLFAAATVAAATLTCRRRERALRSLLLGLSPLLAVVAHLCWRHAFYGEWLPNTYFAKVTAPWPEAGLRYLLCFAFEHGAWLWPLIALAWFVGELRRGPATVQRNLVTNLPATAAVTATIVHVGYYVLRVGGDHFEFRVFSQLVPLGALAAVSMLARLTSRSLLQFATVLALGLAGSIGWVQLALTEDQGPPAFTELSPHAPSWVRPLVHWMDRQRLWLQMHFIGIRFGEPLDHEAILRQFPERRRTPFDLDDIPVAEFRAVGVIGWVLPDVAILDTLGLNDWVAARTPVSSWSMSFLPRDVLHAAMATADGDHDDRCSRGELEAAFAGIPGSSVENARAFVAMLMLLFADGESALTSDEAGSIEPFFAELRFMAHERHAPADYVAAFAPNVTVHGRDLHVAKRPSPRTADDVRRIEAHWRERVRAGQ